MTLRGSCLCCGVRYELDGIDMPVVHCHCMTCRKAHAAAFATTVGGSRKHFRWTAGETLLSAFEPSPGKLRRFCSTCGTHLVAERRGQPHVILRVATLDDDPGVRPGMAIWTSHGVPWLAERTDLASLCRMGAGPRSCKCAGGRRCLTRRAIGWCSRRGPVAVWAAAAAKRVS